MSYINGNRVQCDGCGREIPTPYPTGTILLQETTSRWAWQTFHYHNLEELKAALPDMEQE